MERTPIFKRRKRKQKTDNIRGRQRSEIRGCDCSIDPSKIRPFVRNTIHKQLGKHFSQSFADEVCPRPTEDSVVTALGKLTADIAVGDYGAIAVGLIRAKEKLQQQFPNSPDFDGCITGIEDALSGLIEIIIGGYIITIFLVCLIALIVFYIAGLISGITFLYGFLALFILLVLITSIIYFILRNYLRTEISAARDCLVSVFTTYVDNLVCSIASAISAYTSNTCCATCPNGTLNNPNCVPVSGSSFEDVIQNAVDAVPDPYECFREKYGDLIPSKNAPEEPPAHAFEDFVFPDNLSEDSISLDDYEELL